MFAHALTFKVTERLLIELEKSFAAGKTPVRIITSKDKKAYLEPVLRLNESPQTVGSGYLIMYLKSKKY